MQFDPGGRPEQGDAVCLVRRRTAGAQLSEGQPDRLVCLPALRTEADEIRVIYGRPPDGTDGLLDAADGPLAGS